MRIDKWLWNIRAFKSRTKAKKACANGKVSVNGVQAKPSQSIDVGDLVEFKKGAYNIDYKVLKLLPKRRGYPIAKKCYEDLTPDEEYRKLDKKHIGKGQSEFRERGLGRPTKRDRRKIEEFKRRLFEEL